MQDLITEIDKLLPQTQCGQCSYSGCLPYATAIATQNETIDRCPPGGGQALKALGKLLNKEVTATQIENLQAQEKPTQVAVIRAAECIGCTKCIQACPVDAIVGAAKQLHVVITDQCTGCGLCVTPCPVDCIDMPNASLKFDPNKSRARFHARNKRLEHKRASKKLIDPINDEKIKRQSYIQAAIARVKAKRPSNTTS